MNNFSNIKAMALDRARDAMHKNSPVAAREWVEVAAIADAAARGIYPPPACPDPDAYLAHLATPPNAR